MAHRLPTPGGDNGDWGYVLNDFLGVAHNSDGSLNASAVSSAGAETTSNKNQANGYAGLDGNANVNIANLPTGTTSTTVALGSDPRLTAASTAVQTVNGHSGTSVTLTAGDIAGVMAALTPTAIKTGAYTANVGDLVPVDASAGSVTISLPAAPLDKSRIGIKLVNLGATTNIVTVNAAGSDLFNRSGGNASLTLSTSNQAVTLQYSADSGLWYVFDAVSQASMDGRYAQIDTLTYNFKNHGGKIDGATDDSAALSSLISTVHAAGGGTIFIPAGTCLLANPVNGLSSVTIRGAGRNVTILKGASTFPVPANYTNGQERALIQYVGTFGSSSPSQPIFQNVTITDMTFDCSLINDQHVNTMNGIYQDYSQLRHALFERLGYIGQTNGQFILLGGLGRITGAWSYDITCRDITAINGAGTVSTYLNAVNDPTATYSGVTIENIYNYVSNISNIVDDRVAAVGSQGGGSQTAIARVSDISISHIYVEIDPAQNTTGLVNGVKLDTGTWCLLQNISVRDVFFKGDGSTAAQAPFIVLLGTNGYIQDYLVDGVYGYKCGAVRCRLNRFDYAPSVMVRNVVLEQSHENQGLVQLYTSSGATGDELVTFDSINVHTTTNSGSALMLEGGTSAQGASGAVNIRGLIAKGTSIGISTNKTDTGGTVQAGYNNIHITDSNLSAVPTPFSGTGAYTVKNVVGMVDTDIPVVRNWTSASLTPSTTANTNGTAQVCSPGVNYLGLSIPTIIRGIFSGTFASETVTMYFTATFSDNTTATANLQTPATGTFVMGTSGIISLAKDGTYIKSISVAIQSTIANSQVTATANILAIQ